MVLAVGVGAGQGGEAGSKRAMLCENGSVNHIAPSGPVVMSQFPSEDPLGTQTLLTSPELLIRESCEP